MSRPVYLAIADSEDQNSTLISAWSSHKLISEYIEKAAKDTPALSFEVFLVGVDITPDYGV